MAFVRVAGNKKRPWEQPSKGCPHGRLSNLAVDIWFYVACFISLDWDGRLITSDGLSPAL
jgi:hypothetical protein